MEPKSENSGAKFNEQLFTPAWPMCADLLAFKEDVKATLSVKTTELFTSEM